MSKGKRYSGERKLNYKKVFAVIIAIIVVIMFIFIIKNLLTKAKNTKILQVNKEYFALYEDEKWGILSSTGDKTIEPMYQEMLVVINSEKPVFLCVYDIDQENGTYKTKAINDKNEEIYTGYEKIEAIENYDKDGNIWYEQDVIRVQKDGKYGLINIDRKNYFKYRI